MRSLLAVFCLLFSLNSFATSSVVRDSIGAENSNGNLIIIHKVAPKETYYSIGRLYNISPKDIIEINGNKTLQIGSIVKVPTKRPFIQVQSKPSTTTEEYLTYKVGVKETLYAIAKRFNTDIETIKAINNLKNNNLSVGQLLKIKQGESLNTTDKPVQSGTPTTEVAQVATPTEELEELPVAKIPSNRLGLTERSEKGVAVWISDENLDSSKMLALHRSAPVGTIVKITNPMTDRVTYAKVVGKFNENETTRDVIIVVTKATAEVIGALDKRFRVSIDYGTPNE